MSTAIVCCAYSLATARPPGVAMTIVMKNSTAPHMISPSIPMATPCRKMPTGWVSIGTSVSPRCYLRWVARRNRLSGKSRSFRRSVSSSHRCEGRQAPECGATRETTAPSSPPAAGHFGTAAAACPRGCKTHGARRRPVRFAVPPCHAWVFITTTVPASPKARTSLGCDACGSASSGASRARCASLRSQT